MQVNGRLGKDWLFGPAKDPAEQVNLARANPKKLAELRALLDAYHQARKPSLYRSVADMAVLIDKTLAGSIEAGNDQSMFRIEVQRGSVSAQKGRVFI